jgi:hypothetical protein
MIGNATEGIDVMTGEKILLDPALTLNHPGPIIIEIEK